jgi:hypothetical protein
VKRSRGKFLGGRGKFPHAASFCFGWHLMALAMRER